ncbi:MAG: xanthine dehydrogenase family protein subunit M [Alphaproteobacteria bacterium]|jgi:carbon-monoxide dehydrogenase medium subunit|nr:xanthine dehydrogenase family protein subunit M [Alphaproteobacteria bacterium]
MHHTTYVRAGSTDDAVARMADGGQLLAGGMTLIPTMKQRLASPETLVDLAGCGLAGIEDEGDSIRIGAMTRHADVAGSDLVQTAVPALAALAGGIGDRQVRNRGTIGGSVANNDPSACYPAAVLGLGGTVHTNKRDIAADDFFTGMFETALDEDEMITAVSFPKTGKAAYVKFPNPASRYAMVGVFVASGADGTRLAVTGAGSDGVFRHADMEAALDASFSADSLDGIAVDADEMISDIHASGDYRAHLVREIAKRAVAAC